MPQNFTTVTIALSPEQCTAIQHFPRYGERAAQGMFSLRYRVVDVRCTNGLEHRGLLVMEDGLLLVPENHPVVTAEEILSLAPTPPEAHPDFTVTEPEALRRPGGIEHGNFARLLAFGPRPRIPPPGSLEEVREDAEIDDECIRRYPGEDLPAMYFTPSSLVLVPDGLQMTYRRVSDEAEVTVVHRPTTLALWADVLEQMIALSPDYTLGDFFRLITLSPEVDRAVFQRTVGLRPGMLSEVMSVVGEIPSEDVVQVDVRPFADVDETGYRFWLEPMACGPVVSSASLSWQWRPSGREEYGLRECTPAALHAVPLRYCPTVSLPAPEDETMAFVRGPLRAWESAGRVGPPPVAPELCRIDRQVTLGEFIGAMCGA